MDVSEVVQCWDVCCYHNTLRRWLYGVLSLTPDSICFQNHHTSDSTESHNLKINFSHIKEMKKALSSLMFGAITISTEENKVHWFSSLADRNGTFLILQHFYHEFLVNPSKYAKDTHSNNQDNHSETRTKLGTQLLQSVTDSHQTLAKAAVTLQGQGQQLSAAACVMDDIHQDLSVAQRIVSGLSSWLGRWKIPKVDKKEELILVSDNDIADVLDVEALFTQVSEGRYSPPKECVFRVGTDGVTVLNMKQKVLHKLSWKNVSRIRVISPWEIIFTRFLIGQSDESYKIICVKMPAMLSKMESFCPNKMELMSPDDSGRHHKGKSSTSSNPWSKLSDGPRQFPNHTDVERDFSAQSPTHTQTNIISNQTSQTSKQTAVVSDAEASELSRTLASLKSLALDISEEQDSQLDLIDRVTTSVDAADAKQKQLNQKINKLLK